MAKLVLIGDVASIELTADDEDGQIIATCIAHNTVGVFVNSGCGWTERYDGLGDASEYARDHADTGRV